MNKIVGSKVKTKLETKGLLVDTFKSNEKALSVVTNFFNWHLATLILHFMKKIPVLDLNQKEI